MGRPATGSGLDGVCGVAVEVQAGAADAWFFPAEGVVNFRLIGHIFCSVCISGLCIYILCELHTSRIVCRIENNRMGQATGSFRKSGKCQGFLYCSFSGKSTVGGRILSFSMMHSA